MSDHAGAIWLGSPNHAAGRRAFSYVVMHTMVGSEAAANARFQNLGQQASANYGVCLDGRIVQWVHEADTAWANGTYYNNPGANVDSISIEHEDGGNYNGPRTPALYEASAQLVADICRRRGIPIDRNHVIKHKECYQAATACPDALDVDGIVARALAISGSPPGQVGHGGVLGDSTGGAFLSQELTNSEIRHLYNQVDIIAGQLKPVYDQFTSPTYTSLDARLAVTLAAIADLKATIAALPAAAGGGLTATQASQLNAITLGVSAIQDQLKKDLAP